jgi:hypothetical protein
MPFPASQPVFWPSDPVFSPIETPFSLTDKVFSVVEKGFGKGLKRQKPSKMPFFDRFSPWQPKPKAVDRGQMASGAGDLNEIVRVQQQPPRRIERASHLNVHLDILARV